jgi:hypothetical protein
VLFRRGAAREPVEPGADLSWMLGLRPEYG